MQLFCVDFNSVPNLIVIVFNHVYPVFYVGFYCMGCVWKRVWRLKTLLKTKWISQEVSWEAFPRSEPRVKHMTGMWRVMTTGFREYFVGKAFLRNTRETFCFAILEYLLHHVFTHTIYTYITHILEELLFREKTLDITLKS